MDRALLVRLVALYAPATIAGIAWAIEPPRRRAAIAALVASGWLLPSLLFANVVAAHAGWWGFAPAPGAIAGMPADLLLGWVVLWGVLPTLLAPRAPAWLVAAVLVALDVVVMPLGAPVVVLGDRWLAGEAIAVAVALVPSRLLAQWTLGRTYIALRGSMQALACCAILLWMLPELVFLHTGGNWAQLRRTWTALGGLPLQLVAVPLVVGIAAVREFAERGGGTPIPFDPPRRLVTSGPYAYVANPMQLAMALSLTMWGLVIGSIPVALAGPMAVVYGLGLAAWSEGDDLARRFGTPWQAYRRHVREWIPQLRPWIAEDRAPARLYVAATCGPCSEVAAWFAARAPRGLEVVPAELHPSRDLERVTYDPGDGTPDFSGVAAIARALGHVHLGWAFAGWVMELPGVRTGLQLLVDASGGEARRIARLDAATFRDAMEVRACTR